MVVYFLYRDCYGHLALNLYKLKFNDIEKKSAKPCKTGVILVKRYFTVLPCSSSSSSSG